MAINYFIIKNLSVVIFIFLTLIMINVNAETYEEFKKRLLKKQQNQTQQFNDFQSAQNKAFYGYLKQQWEDFQVSQGKPEDSNPKPVEIPKIKISKKPVPLKIIRPNPQPNKFQPPPPPVVQKPTKITSYPIKVSFFSNPVHWQGDAKWQKWRQTHIHRLSNNSIADYWKAFSALNSTLILKQLNKTSQQLNLNDWGKIKLLSDFGRTLNLSDNQTLLTLWALLNKDGYDVRIGYHNNSAYLLYHSKQRLYSLPYFKFNNKRYYLYSLQNTKTKKIKSYKGNLNASPKALNLQLVHPPMLIAQKAKKHNLSMQWKDTKYEFSIPIYKSEISYLNTLPQQQLKNYFKFTPSKHISKSILPALRLATNKMPAIEKVNFLLRFVQTAFPYATDDQQFNYENYLLPDETFYYPASDCEDRSILFAWLITQLTPYQVIALDYPGHIATAVALPEEITPSGKKYIFQGKKFTVTDPTYINSSIGMEMPQFKNTTPEFIAIN
jgi:hypothetical protein